LRSVVGLSSHLSGGRFAPTIAVRTVASADP